MTGQGLEDGKSTVGYGPGHSFQGLTLQSAMTSTVYRKPDLAAELSL